MTDYSTLVLTAVIAVITGSLATIIGGLILAKMQPRDPGSPARQSLTIVGDGNDVHQETTTHNQLHIVQQVTNVRETIRDQLPTQSSTPEDDWVRMGGVALAGLLVALAYLVAWPWVIGAIAGLAVATVLLTLVYWWMTEPGKYPRGVVLTNNVLAGLGALAASSFVLWPRFAEFGVVRVTRRAATEFPTFDDSTGSRWSVLRTNFSRVVDHVGMDGITALLAQASFAVFVVIALIASWRNFLNWWSFRRVAYGRTHSDHAVARAQTFLSLRWSSVMATLASIAIACFMASGAAGGLMNLINTSATIGSP